jgi:hypothetical protein
VAASLSVPVHAQKGGGTKVTTVEYPAEITFWSRAEDGVKSDGGSARVRSLAGRPSKQRGS